MTRNTSSLFRCTCNLPHGFPSALAKLSIAGLKPALVMKRDKHSVLPGTLMYRGVLAKTEPVGHLDSLTDAMPAHEHHLVVNGLSNKLNHYGIRCINAVIGSHVSWI
jgi:hypothetical protein